MAFWKSRWGRSMGISVFVGAFLALAGAFHTGEAPLLPRLAYWIGLMVAGSAFAVWLRQATARIPFVSRRPLLALALTMLVMAILFTGVVWLSIALIFGVDFKQLVAAGPSVFVMVFLYTLLMACGMAALHVLASRRLVETHAAAPGALPVRFLERLPAKLRGADIYAVEAEDHYLRLHTSRGSDLILMRLSDAVVELEGIEGARTHRSWWVARAGVSDARRGDGRGMLTLKDGTEAPVSRTHAAALRRAGWF